MAILGPCAKAFAVISVLCQFAADGRAQNGNQPEEFAAYITSQVALLAKLFQQTGVTAH